MRLHCVVAAGIALAAGSSFSHAQFLMIPDSTADRIMLFSAFDGSVVNLNFITDANSASTYNFDIPLEPLQIGNEIWISDQNADSLFRFDLNGNYMSKVTGGMDNIRGIEHVNGKVYVTNAGTNNGAPGNSIITFDTAGNNLGFVSTPSLFDLYHRGGELLASNIDGDNIERYSLSGALLGTLVNSDGVTGIDFPQQISTRASNGNLLVGGFSPPDGVYEFTPAGAQVAVYAANFGPRAAYELGNGKILWTNGSQVATVDPSNGAITTIVSGVGARYINPLVPAPGAVGAFAIAGLAGLRRRR